MPDYHQVVDQIRALVQSSGLARSERLEVLASAYATACAEVNERLSRCQWMLRQGLRTEALHVAETEPKLLDAVAVLDFPERSDWEEVVSMYEMAAPQKLLIHAAGFVDEAYALNAPIQDLLRQHRRLSTQRAPLRTRLKILRQIAALDLENPIWAEELRGFEKERIRQIRLETAEATRLEDRAHLKRLRAELEGQTWIETPPENLIQGLTSVDAQARARQARLARVDLEKRLTEAFHSRDPINGRIARREWNALIVNAGGPVAPDDPILRRVRPIFAWLAEEDRRDQENRDHKEALSELIAALDDPRIIPSASLMRLVHAVLQFGRGMPESIQARCASQLKEAGAAAARRFRFIAAMWATGIVLAGSLVFYLVREYARADRAIEAATTISDLLKLGELEKATTYFAKLKTADSGLLSYPAMLSAQQNLDNARAEETKRALQFDEALREAE